jgi:Tfp pilus assembly protein PilN
MIKINLATKKASVQSAGEDGKKSTPLGAGFSKLDLRLDAIKDLPIRKIATAALACMAGSYLLDGYKEDEMKKVDAALSKVTAEQTRLRAEVAKSKGFEAMKKQLEADEFSIRTKIETIEKLVADRQTPPKILLAVANTIPAEVWLQTFKMADGEASFRGYATNYNQISDFMKNLNENAYFTDLRLVGTSQTKDSGGSEAASFELSAKRR